MTEYELNNLPRSPSGQRMLSRVSPIYDKSIFMKFYYEAVGSEFDEVRKYFDTLREQSFTQSVDWAIEFQEYKYSVTPDKTLTLTERRARLKIKTSKKYPLNPAVLEKYAAENFGLNVYLDESEAGYIGLTLDSYLQAEKFIKWLLLERPAHLMIRVTIVKREEKDLYVGLATLEKGKIQVKSLDDVLMIFSGIAHYEQVNLIVDADTVKIPRDLFIGIVDNQGGRLTVKADTDYNQWTCHGVAHYLHGRVTIDVDGMNYQQKVFAGIIACAGGKLTIDAEPAEEELNIFSGIAQALRGKITVDSDDGLIIVPSDNNQLTIYFNFDSGQRQLTLNNPREDLTEQDIQDVGNFAAQKGLLINSSGETVTGTSKFALIESDKPRLWTQRRINRYFPNK